MILLEPMDHYVGMLYYTMLVIRFGVILVLHCSYHGMYVLYVYVNVHVDRNLSKVIHRKDLPRIYTMCLPHTEVDDSKPLSKSLIDLAATREEVTQQVSEWETLFLFLYFAFSVYS